MGMPLVLRPKTLPMAMFQPKCQPKAKPSRPPVRSTLRPPAMPPTKMFNLRLRAIEVHMSYILYICIVYGIDYLYYVYI